MAKKEPEVELTEAEQILEGLDDIPTDKIFDVTILTAQYIKGTYEVGREVSVSIDKDVAEKNNIDFVPLNQLNMLIACKHIRAIGRTSRVPRGVGLTKEEISKINLEKARAAKKQKADAQKREEEIEAEVEKRLNAKLAEMQAANKAETGGGG